MATLAEQTAAKISDLDSQIDRIQAMADEQIKGLKAKRRALVDAAKALTPEIEQAVATLRQLNLIEVR